MHRGPLLPGLEWGVRRRNQVVRILHHRHVPAVQGQRRLLPDTVRTVQDKRYCGSGIRCPFDPWIRDPGWVEVSIRIRDPG